MKKKYDNSVHCVQPSGLFPNQEIIGTCFTRGNLLFRKGGLLQKTTFKR